MADTRLAIGHYYSSRMIVYEWFYISIQSFVLDLEQTAMALRSCTHRINVNEKLFIPTNFVYVIVIKS